MEKKELLEKTNRGLNIYAFVLRRYYPYEDVLKLRGDSCERAKNPFNNSKPTLMVTLKDNLATHTDLDNAIPAGDALDFARLMMPLDDEPLCQMLARVLFPEPVEEADDVSPHAPIPHPVFSFFKKPLSNVRPAAIVNLKEVYSCIRGNDYKKQTEVLRKVTTRAAMHKLKASDFDYVTFSGVFALRNEDALICHSGLMTIDFDDVDDLPALKQTLLNDDYFFTELMFVSPSGKGLKWIVAVNLDHCTHKHYFRALHSYLHKKYGLVADKSGSDVSRCCLLGHDPEAYINPVYNY